MSKQDQASEQVRFLVSCIGHTSNGRPDFAAVAEELGIVSKAAAHKRYERLLKAHNVSPTKLASGPGKPSDGEDKPQTPTKRKTGGGSAAATESAKKRGRPARGKQENGVKEEAESGSYDAPTPDDEI